MKIAWLGHHCYRITLDSGLKIITDPYCEPEFNTYLMGDLQYDSLDESADVVLVSHEHGDHNNVEAIKGNPEVIRGQEIRGSSKKVKGIDFNALACHHFADFRQPNNMFFFEVDGMRVCHSGDLGHELATDQVAELGTVDILLLAVGYPNRSGSHFIIDTAIADALYRQLKPRVVLPGHYSNRKCTFKIAIVDEFLEGKPGVIRLDEKDISEVELEKEELPASTQIMVLKSVY